MTSISAALLSLASLASFALIFLGMRLAFTRPLERKRGLLMVIAGVVILTNVYLFATWPTPPVQQTTQPRQ